MPRHLSHPTVVPTSALGAGGSDAASATVGPRSARLRQLGTRRLTVPLAERLAEVVLGVSTRLWVVDLNRQARHLELQPPPP
jgi:hypothetical protein